MVTALPAVGLVVAGVVLAGVGVRATARTARAAGLWWAAALGAAAATAAILRAGTPVPAGAAVTGAGWAAAAVVDTVEGRVPTPLAYATTAAGSASLVAHGWLTGEWRAVALAACLTVVLVVAYAVLWVAGGLGFGDVRLVGGAGQALLGGVPALLGFSWIVAVAVGAVAGLRRAFGHPAVPGTPGSVPLAPAMAVAWLCAVTLL